MKPRPSHLPSFPGSRKMRRSEAVLATKASKAAAEAQKESGAEATSCGYWFAKRNTR
jgi:hypothetical protein